MLASFFVRSTDYESKMATGQDVVMESTRWKGVDMAGPMHAAQEEALQNESK
jgi:hypothetical protein